MRAIIAAVLVALLCSAAQATIIQKSVNEYGPTVIADTLGNTTDTVRFLFDPRFAYSTVSAYLFLDSLADANVSVRVAYKPSPVLSVLSHPDSLEDVYTFHYDSLDHISLPDSVYWENWSGSDSVALINVPEGRTSLVSEELRLNTSGVVDFYVTSSANVFFAITIYIFRQ